MKIFIFGVAVSPCCGGFQYHYFLDGKERTSFNYWPTRLEAYLAGHKEKKNHDQ